MGVVCIKLDDSTWEAAKAQLALIGLAEAELARHRALLEMIVSQGTGKDVSSGVWNLDIRHGLLEGEEPDVNEEKTEIVNNESQQDDLSSRRASKARSQSRRRDSIRPTDNRVS